MLGIRGRLSRLPQRRLLSFNQINIPAPIAGERFGYTFDGSSNLNGDGYTDMLVGYSNGIYAYIYFGSPTGLPTAPSVSILGTASTFGQSVAVIGDINKDGHPDIAIGSPREGNGVVYVFLGRATWPANLTSTNADCVISTDSTADTGYATSRLGFRMAAAGDFNGDGVDDFVISAAYYNSTQGQLAIIYGNSAGLPTTISLPSAFGTAATRINGDAAFAGRLGDNVLGIGRFYGASTNPAIVASAPFGPAGGSNGRLYSFVGQNGTPASMDVGAATNTYDGPAGVLYGAAAVTALGNIGIPVSRQLAYQCAHRRAGKFVVEQLALGHLEMFRELRRPTPTRRMRLRQCSSVEVFPAPDRLHPQLDRAHRI